MWHCLTYILRQLKSLTSLEAKSSSQIHILATWSFLIFSQRKHRSLNTPQMVLSNRSMVYDSSPRHSIAFFCVILHLKDLCGALGREKYEGILPLHIL
jgi:hypothetical protein